MIYKARKEFFDVARSARSCWRKDCSEGLMNFAEFPFETNHQDRRRLPLIELQRYTRWT